MNGASEDVASGEGTQDASRAHLPRLGDRHVPPSTCGVATLWHPLIVQACRSGMLLSKGRGAYEQGGAQQHGRGEAMTGQAVLRARASCAGGARPSVSLSQTQKLGTDTGNGLQGLAAG